MNNAFSAYKKQSVTTLTPGDVVVKLYMEAERQLNRASYYIPLKNYEETNKAYKGAGRNKRSAFLP